MANYKDEGDALSKEGKFQEAVDAYTLALKQCKADSEIQWRTLSNRAAAYAQLRKLDNAFADAKSLIKLKPEWSKARLRYGSVLSMLGRYEEAALQFRVGVELESQDKELKASLQKAAVQAIQSMENAALSSEVHMWGEATLALAKEEGIEYANKKKKTCRTVPKENDCCPYPVLSRGLTGHAVRQVDLGRTHGVMVTVTGEVFTWGNRYLLGEQQPYFVDPSLTKKLLRDPSFFIDVPQIVEGLHAHRICRVAAGEYHTLALSEKGKVYSWGANFAGNLGYSTQECHPSNAFFAPKRITALGDHHIIQVACGLVHSVVLTEDGTVLTFGANNQGQLGVGFTPAATCDPQVVALSDAISISAARRHTAVVLRSGSVYTFGGNYRGCLGYVPNVHVKGNRMTANDIVISRSNFAAHFGVLLSSRAFTDLHVFVGGEEFGMHKCILAARCPPVAAVLAAHPAATEFSLSDLLFATAAGKEDPAKVSLVVDLTTKPVWAAFVAYIYGDDRAVFEQYRTDVVKTKEALEGLGELFGLPSIVKSLAVFSQTSGPPDESASLQKQLGALLESGAHSDVVICAGGQRFRAHRCVLAARTPYFRAMFDTGMKEASAPEGEVNFPEETAETMQDLLTFIYSDQLKMRADDAGERVVQLLASASMYGVTRLVEALERTVAASVDACNVYALLQFAEQLGTPQLYSFCLNLLVEMYPDVNEMDEFKSMGDELCAAVKAEYTQLVSQQASGTPDHREDNTFQTLPRRVPNLLGKMMKSVCCADKLTVALDASGYLYMWGVGSHPKWKHMVNASPLLAAHHVPFEETIVDIACGSSHVLALSESGKVYAWGAGSLGQTVPSDKGKLLHTQGPTAAVDIQDSVAMPAEMVAAGAMVSSLTRGLSYTRDAAGATLGEDLLRAAREGAAYDVVLRAGGATRKAHRAVVCSRSACVAAAVNENKGQKEADLPNGLSKEELDVFVDFLYSGEAPTRDAQAVFEQYAKNGFRPEGGLLSEAPCSTPTGIPVGHSLKELASGTNEDGADLVLKLVKTGTTFFCHRDVVAARCPFVRAAFSEGVPLEHDGVGRAVVPVNSNASDDAMRCILRYIYCDDDVAPLALMKEIADLTEELVLSRLRFRVQVYWARQVDVTNVVECVAIAHASHLLYLREICLRYVRRNLAIVQGMPAFEKLDGVLRIMCDADSH